MGADQTGRRSRVRLVRPGSCEPFYKAPQVVLDFAMLHGRQRKFASTVVRSYAAMPHHTASPHPPRRHLVLTAVVVVVPHLVLLGASPKVMGGTVPASPLSASPSEVVSAPQTVMTPQPKPAAIGTDLRLQIVSLSPQHALPSAVSEPRAVEVDDVAPPSAEPARWTVAQASPDSEQSLRQNSNDSKALPPVKVPSSARMGFDVLGKIKGFGYTVSGDLSWQQDGRQYQTRFEIGLPLLGSRVQTSQGQLGPAGLMPTRFGDKVRSEQAAHFERDKGIISFSANTPSVPLENGAQDRLSLFFQLGALLAGAPQRYPAGSQITLQTVSAREAEPWTFRVDGLETLQIPLGSMAAIRLTRLPRQPYDQRVDLWFAPSLGYLPVRLRVTHPNEDVADQVLRRLDPIP